MTWWQIILLIVGVLWTIAATAFGALALCLGGMFQTSKPHWTDYAFSAIAWAVGPTLIIVAVAT